MTTTAAPPAWVYLLRCRDGSLYTGWTNDLDKRLLAHAAGKASRYTRARLPVALAAALPMPDPSAARREEARIKRLRTDQKHALVASAARCCTGDVWCYTSVSAHADDQTSPHHHRDRRDPGRP